MSSTAKISIRSRLQGMTLIELLVVVAVVTLLSAITLPTLRTVMTQRKSSQAAILVKNAVETARMRAIATGRRVALALERISSRATRNDQGVLVPEIASSSDYMGNYDLYNTCVRMSFMEVPPPVEYENVTFNLTDNILQIPIAITSDARFLQTVRDGSFIEFPNLPAIGRQLEVLEVRKINAGDPVVTIVVDNTPATPANRAAFYYNSILISSAIRAPIPSFPPLPSTFSAPTLMSVQTLPKPVATQVVDLPKGTCIDLSLSGFASDTRWSHDNESGVQSIINLRDTRRHFASDWAWPTNDPTLQPDPTMLRPIYLFFGPNGLLDTVAMNQISGASSTIGFTNYDMHDDVYLFVGKTDQIIRIDGTPNTTGIAATQGGVTSPDIYPADLEAQNIKANINDSSCQWVRISPNSGSTSVASVASAYETPLFNIMPTATSFSTIGEVLARSRSLSFTDEATAQ